MKMVVLAGNSDSHYPNTKNIKSKIIKFAFFFQFSKTEEQWKTIAEQFRIRQNFDTCVGSIDEKHVNIVKAANSGSYFYNYKGKFSIVLMTICQYEFIMVHPGTNGKVSDCGILNETKFFELLMFSSLLQQMNNLLCWKT